MEKKTIRICSLCSAALMAGMFVFHFINTFGRVFMWAPYALFVLLALVLAAFPAPRKLRLLFLLPGVLLLYMDCRQLINLIPYYTGGYAAFTYYLSEGTAAALRVLSALSFLLFLPLRSFAKGKWGKVIPSLWFLPAILLPAARLGLLDTLWEIAFFFGFFCLCYVLFMGEVAEQTALLSGETGISQKKMIRGFALGAAVLLIVPVIDINIYKASSKFLYYSDSAKPDALPYLLFAGCALLVCFLPARRKLRLLFLIPGALLAAQYYQEIDTFFQNTGLFNRYSVTASGTCLFGMMLFLLWILLRSFAKGNLLRFVSTFWFLPGIVQTPYLVIGSLGSSIVVFLLGLRFLCCALFAGTDAPQAVPSPASAGTAPADPAPPAPADPAPAAETPSSAPETEAAPSGARFCPRCGRPLTPDAAFCPHCGGRVEQD